jgi:hypothetical protein
VQMIRQRRRRFGEISWCAARRLRTSVTVVVFCHLSLPTALSSFSSERRRRVWTEWFVWRVLRWSTSAVTWFRWCSCFGCGDSLRRIVSACVRARVSVRSAGVRFRVGRLLSSGRFVRLPRIRLSRSVRRRGQPENDRV